MRHGDGWRRWRLRTGRAGIEHLCAHAFLAADRRARPVDESRGADNGPAVRFELQEGGDAQRAASRCEALTSADQASRTMLSVAIGVPAHFARDIAAGGSRMPAMAR